MYSKQMTEPYYAAELGFYWAQDLHQHQQKEQSSVEMLLDTEQRQMMAEKA